MSSEELPEDAEEAAVLEAVAASSQHVVEQLMAEGMPQSPEELKARLMKILCGEDGPASLLGAAFEAGKEQGLGENPGARHPRWEDVKTLGERKARLREENLCGQCANQVICVVARSTPAELLAAVSRCLSFIPTTQ